jgi:hypothetical protein
MREKGNLRLETEEEAKVEVGLCLTQGVFFLLKFVQFLCLSNYPVQIILCGLQRVKRQNKKG